MPTLSHQGHTFLKLLSKQTKTQKHPMAKNYYLILKDPLFEVLKDENKRYTMAKMLY